MKCRFGTPAVVLTAVLVPAAVQADPPDRFWRANPNGNQLIVRAAPADAQAIAEQHGLSVVATAATAEGDLAVVEGPELMTGEQITALIAGDPRIEGLEDIRLASLPGTAEASVTPALGDVQTDLLKSGDFSTPCLSQGFGAALWSGYADQEAARQVRLHEAHAQRADCAAATVAVIDTGVDPQHPMLAGALLPGYDFILEQEGVPSEWDFLDQSLQPILEQSLQPILEQSLQPILEQSLQPILEAVTTGEGEALTLGSQVAVLLDQASVAAFGELAPPPYFGHGTMVAGLVRLAAPGAAIMPLRVFNGSGSAHLFDIVRAIYWAVDHGADVINMSFSMPESSTELKRAVQYARSHGVICVASAGNQGESALVYPAAYAASVGVAATTAGDQLSEFSNHGNALVELAAPGSGVVSTYPGGVFGAGWGTSFSAPLVAGTLALIHAQHGGDAAAFQAAVHDLNQGSVAIQELAGDIGSGRLDVLGTVLEAE